MCWERGSKWKMWLSSCVGVGVGVILVLLLPISAAEEGLKWIDGTNKSSWVKWRWFEIMKYDMICARLWEGKEGRKTEWGRIKPWKTLARMANIHFNLLRYYGGQLTFFISIYLLSRRCLTSQRMGFNLLLVTDIFSLH